MAVCPRCGGQNFQYELRSGGTYSNTSYYRTGVKRSWFIPAGRKTYQSYRKQQTIGFCRDCGYIVNPQAELEVKIFFYLLCFIFWPIALSVWFYKSEKIPLGKKSRLLVLALVWLGLPMAYTRMQGTETALNQYSDKQSAVIATQNSVWQDSITELSEFDYYIEDETIILTAYNGQQTKIRIASSYEVNGEKLQVIALEGTFALKSIDSVIIPNGVTQITNNTFNSCGIEYVYFPSTLISFNGWNYLHDLKTIYYGGSRQQWNALCGGNSQRLDATEILYDVNLSTLVNGR